MNRKSYVVVGSAVGGVLAYLLLTRSGRRRVESMRGVNVKSFPHKVEEILDSVERCTHDLSGRLEGLRERILSSIDAGRRGYDEAEGGYRSHIRGVESRSNEVAGSIHHTVDELNRTIQALQKSVLDSVHQLGSIARGIQRGIRTMAG